MKHAFLLLSLVVALAGCAYRPAPLSGLEYETIHLPQDLPGGGWGVTTERNAEATLKRWHRAGESMLLSVRRSRAVMPPDLFRHDADADAQGRPRLAFRSTVLTEARINGYRRIAWRTESTLPGGEGTESLLLYIEGNDASYFIEHRWDGPPAAEFRRRAWLDYLLAVTVCDPRSAEHPCP
jgi:hypothetical protein